MWELFKGWIMWLALREQEEMEEKPLGFISDKYESGEGKTDAATISNTKGDPGGKSYGVFQLSLNAGTLQKYLKQSKFRAYLSGFPVAGRDFDIMWGQIADNERERFVADQTDFITKTHYIPAMMFAQSQGFNLTHRAVQEAIFSISVQHGGYKIIIKQARKLKESKSIEHQVKALYQARTKYVQGLNSLPQKIKDAILNRYVREQSDVLNLL